MSEEESTSEEIPQSVYMLAFLLAFGTLIWTMFAFPLWSA
jgi:hypothetical protein